MVLRVSSPGTAIRTLNPGHVPSKAHDLEAPESRLPCVLSTPPAGRPSTPFLPCGFRFYSVLDFPSSPSPPFSSSPSFTPSARSRIAPVDDVQVEDQFGCIPSPRRPSPVARPSHQGPRSPSTPFLFLSLSREDSGSIRQQHSARDKSKTFLSLTTDLLFASSSLSRLVRRRCRSLHGVAAGQEVSPCWRRSPSHTGSSPAS